MNAAHLHLMINHLPVLGTVFGLLLLAAGTWRKSEELKRAALATFVLVALAAIATYLTGEPAEDVAKKGANFAGAFFEKHEDLAGAAMAGSVVIGVAALFGLVWYQGPRLMKPWFGTLVLVAALVVTGLMAYTAYLGGRIGHPELGGV